MIFPDLLSTVFLKGPVLCCPFLVCLADLACHFWSSFLFLGFGLFYLFDGLQVDSQPLLVQTPGPSGSVSIYSSSCSGLECHIDSPGIPC